METLSLVNIFIISFTTSLVSFGGGYLIIPILKNEYVVKRKGLTADELEQISSISQSAPGAIALNFTGGIGYRLRGLLGAVVAVIGSIIPPFIIIVLVSRFYNVLIENNIIQSMINGLDLSVIAIMIGLNLTMFFNLFKRLGIKAHILAGLFFILVYFSSLPIPVLIILNYFLVSTLGLKEIHNATH
ncbi:chromate transporter [Erysipelothrix urinaevulpis]|uniref:chromate transporter n=1 Tax=Erysipelothrix urinaevulpis TaxID=2683717 RepID=UPI00135754F5|nr:chromate transporter [Erysipelothrix urinaevulpis]